MRTTVFAIVLLMEAFNLNLVAQVQSSVKSGSAAAKGVDLAITYAPERAKITDTACDCFWF